MQNIDKQEPVLGLDIQVFMDVIATGDSERRISLARQIAAFIADEATPAGERNQVQPVAMRLAADPDITVRQAFAVALEDIPDLPADLLFAILADGEDVALPFLAATRALDLTRTMAVLKAGDPAHQAVIVSRQGLLPEVVDMVVLGLPLAINMLLLENPEAVLTPEHYHILHERFGEDRDMLDLLLSRPDLPAVIRIVQARRAAANLSSMLVRRNWLPGARGRDLAADAEENATLGVLVMAPPAELAPAVTFLLDNEFLTSSLIVHAACKGAMDVVAQCLASLAGIPLRRAEEHMYGRGRFKSLFARCALPQSCYWTLKAACDTAREERHEGANLTADEFGRRMIETGLTRYAEMPPAEQPRLLDFLARFGTEPNRHLAAKLRNSLQRAA